MRKLTVSNIMSLDGYYEGPGNNLMVMPVDEAFDTYNVERLRVAGIRRTARRFAPAHRNPTHVRWLRQRAGTVRGSIPKSLKSFAPDYSAEF